MSTRFKTKVVTETPKVSTKNLSVGDIFIWNKRVYMFLDSNEDGSINTYNFSVGDTVTLNNVSTVVPVKEAELIVKSL